MFYIDRQYQRGYGVERDFLKATEYYKKSSELGNAMPHNNLAWLYQKGNGVEQNYTRAIELYKKSSAFNNLAFMYSEGHEVKRDHSKAVELYKIIYNCKLNNMMQMIIRFSKIVFTK